MIKTRADDASNHALSPVSIVGASAAIAFEANSAIIDNAKIDDMPI
jgi:hypothetical protein